MTIDYLIGHQANLRMLTAAVHRLHIPESKHLYNVDEFGNQGGAGLQQLCRKLGPL